MMTDSDKKIYAEEILQNPLFCDILNQMKNDAVSSCMNLKWDQDGDALRRRNLLKIELIEEIFSKFVFYKNRDQSKIKKPSKNKGDAT